MRKDVILRLSLQLILVSCFISPAFSDTEQTQTPTSAEENPHPLSGAEQRFLEKKKQAEADRVRTEDQRRLDLRRALEPYLLRVKEKIESKWSPNASASLDTALVRLTVDANGKLIEPKILVTSKSESFDKSIVDSLDAFVLPALPAGTPTLDLYMTFMADSTTKLVEFSESSDSDHYYLGLIGAKVGPQGAPISSGAPMPSRASDITPAVQMDTMGPMPTPRIPSFQKDFQSTDVSKASGEIQNNRMATAPVSDVATNESDEPQLLDQWAQWRDRVSRTVAYGVQETLRHPDDSILRLDPDRNTVMPRFPMGTCAWIFCEVRNDRHIIKLRIVRTSGYTDYDKTVLDAVQSLDNSKILTFPSGSKWVHVTQTFGVKTGDLGVVSAKLALLPAPAPTPTPTPAAAADIWTPFESDLHRRIKIAWDKRAPSIRNLNTREVILTLHVLMDGHVDTVELTQSSSNKTADHAAIDAVHEAAPFLPLPEGATGPRLVQVHFDTSGSDVRGD